MGFGQSPLVHTDEAALAESTGSPSETVQLVRGACSSAEERALHTGEVGGSKPSTPTANDAIAKMLADDAWRMKVEERFWPKVMKPLDWSACWTWNGAQRRTGPSPGYGTFKLRSYETVRAHRVSYALYYGHSPGDLFVCHRCDNPRCVNPSHLFLGTCQDNSADMVAKGRGAKRDQKGERNGAAKLTEAKVEVIRRCIIQGESNTTIARRFGVSHQLISRIRRGRSWGNVPMQDPYASLRA